MGLVDRPPPTHKSKPGPNSGCTVPTKDTSLISGGDIVRRVPGQCGLELAWQVGVRRVAECASLDLSQCLGAVDDLVLGDPGDG
jgi:hypothetical protein